MKRPCGEISAGLFLFLFIGWGLCAVFIEDTAKEFNGGFDGGFITGGGSCGHGADETINGTRLILDGVGKPVDNLLIHGSKGPGFTLPGGDPIPVIAEGIGNLLDGLAAGVGLAGTPSRDAGGLNAETFSHYNGLSTALCIDDGTDAVTYSLHWEHSFLCLTKYRIAYKEKKSSIF